MKINRAIIPLLITFLLITLLSTLSFAARSIPLTVISKNSNETTSTIETIISNSQSSISNLPLSNDEIEGAHVVNVIDENDKIQSLTFGSGLVKSDFEKFDDSLFNSTLISEEYTTQDGKIPVIISLNVEKFYSQEVGEPVGVFGEVQNEFNEAPSRMTRELAFQNAKSEVVSLLQTSAVKTDLKIVDAVAIDISLDQLESLQNSTAVEKVYLDKKVNVFLQNSTPLINATEVWRQLDSNGNNLTGRNISIAIIDTGIDYTHPDLGGCLGASCRVKGGYDFANGDSDPMDDHGHGTHVAATAAGNGTLLGVAPQANMYGYKVLSSGGWGYWSWVISGIDRSTDPNNDGVFSDHVNISSMSLGGSGNEDDLIAQAIDRGVDRGVIFVVAAGNSGSAEGAVGTPASARKAITVAASDKSDLIAYFSSRGPTPKFNLKPDLTAPGVNICAAQWDSWLNSRRCVDDRHISISGTSMATPHVSGAAALLLQKNPTWSPEKVKSALMLTSKDLGYNAWTQGSGRINVSKALSPLFLTYPQSISFGQISNSSVTKQVTIENLNSSSLTLSLSVGLIVDKSGNTYNASYIVNSSTGNNITSITVPQNNNATFNITINLGSAEGTLSGFINISVGNEIYRVPYGVTRLSGLTVSVVDTKGNTLQPYFIAIHNSDLSTVKYAFLKSSFTFDIPAGNYAAHALGDSSNRTLNYILTGNTTVASGTTTSLTLGLNGTRTTNVTAKDTRNNSLDLYMWQYLLKERKGIKSFSTGVGFFGFGFPGDRIVRATDTTNETLDEINISLSYIGYPTRNNTFNVPEYTWASETYNTANELYFMGWILNGISSSTPSILNYTASSLGTLNYTYNWPGHDPNQGASDAGFAYSAINFWISPASSFAIALWERIAVPLNRIFYVNDATWGFWHYIHPNYLRFSYWFDEFIAAANQYEHDIQYKKIWPIGTRVTGGSNRDLYFGTTPYLPTHFQNTNTTIKVRDNFLTGFNNETYVFKNIDNTLGVRAPRFEIYKNGVLDSNTTSWGAFSFAGGNGKYIVNITVPSYYPIQNETNIVANFTMPASDVNPPKITYLNISPRFIVNENLGFQFNITDDFGISAVSAYYSYDSGGWNSISLTNISQNYTGSFNITNATATRVNIRISANDTSDNRINYTFTPLSMLGRNISFTFTSSKSTANLGNTLTFTGTAKDETANIGIYLAKVYYNVNDTSYDRDRTASSGTIGAFDTKWIVPSNYQTTRATFSVNFTGTGVYLPGNKTLAITINVTGAGPGVSNIVISPISPDVNDNVTINSTWSNANTVLFESNFTNSFANYTPIQNGSVYRFTIGSGNFSLNNVIGYRFHANDSSNVFSSSTLQTFTIQAIATNITAGQTLLETNTTTSLFCDYMEVGNGDVTGATVQVEINSTNSTMNYNSTSGRYEYAYNTIGDSTGTKNWKCYANKTNYTSKIASSSFSIRAEATIPTYSNVARTSDPIYNDMNVMLNTSWQNNANLTIVIFSSNYSGSWVNYTITQDAPVTTGVYNATYTILSGNFSSNQVVGWKYFAADASDNWNYIMPIQTFTVENRVPLINFTNNQTDKGWGEQWTFKVNVSDPDADTLNVSLWSKPVGGNYVVEETQSVNLSNSSTVNITFIGRYFNSSNVGTTTMKFNVTDSKGGNNESSEINVTVEKDDVTITINRGSNGTIERFGKDNITLGIQINDTDKSELVNTSAKIYITRDNVVPYDVIQDCTSSNGNCSVNLDPDTTYDVGIQYFIGGTLEADLAYKAVNSSQVNFTVLGRLFVLVNSPYGGFNETEFIYLNGTVFTDQTSPNDPNPTSVSADSINLEYRKGIGTSEWTSCTPVNETTGIHGNYYFCVINATQHNLTFGFYSIRYSATKANFTDGNTTNTYQFWIFKIIKYNQIHNFTANFEHRINTTEMNISLRIRPNATTNNVQVNITFNSSNPAPVNLSVQELGKYYSINVSDILRNNLTYTTIEVNYTDDEINKSGVEESSLRLYRFNGTNWTAYNNQSSDYQGGVNTELNYVWGNVTGFSDFGVGGTKANKQACTSNSECNSGNCAADYDGEGSWCAPSGYCASNYNVSYTNGYILCSDSSTKQTCSSGIWTSQACSAGCSAGACLVSSSSSSTGGGGGGAAGGAISEKREKAVVEKISHPVDNLLQPKTLKAIVASNEEIKDAMEKVFGELTDKDLEQLATSTASVVSDISAPSRTLTTGTRTSTLSLSFKYSGKEPVKNFAIYDTVPKAFANSTDDITVGAPGAAIEIIRKDPVYLISYTQLNPEKTVEVNYTINKNVDKTVIESVPSPIILAGEVKEEIICIQVITPAVNPATNECREFPTPCDVPQGWVKVDSCPAVSEPDKYNQLIIGIIAAVAIAGLVIYIKSKKKAIPIKKRVIRRRKSKKSSSKSFVFRS